jgi:hypothetical protein
VTLALSRLYDKLSDRLPKERGTLRCLGVRVSTCQELTSGRYLLATLTEKVYFILVLSVTYFLFLRRVWIKALLCIKASSSFPQGLLSLSLLGFSICGVHGRLRAQQALKNKRPFLRLAPSLYPFESFVSQKTFTSFRHS